MSNRLRQEKILEALLFAAGEAVPVANLSRAIGCDIPATRGLLLRMKEHYISENAGIQLMELEDAFLLCTNPDYHKYVQYLLPQTAIKRTLTQTLLETLSIIAYKQPVTKTVIEEIRGVNADHAVNKLIEYGLVTERGRMDAPGKPILFGTTDGFLKHFGLKSVDEFLQKSMQEQREMDEGVGERNRIQNTNNLL